MIIAQANINAYTKPNLKEKDIQIQFKLIHLYILITVAIIYTYASISAYIYVHVANVKRLFPLCLIKYIHLTK